MTYRTTTKLYVFQQNNTFGTFDAGVGHTVLAEALTREEACARAQTVGVYFNGCATGRDCDCCGNRWEEPWDTPLPFERPLGTDTLEEYLPRFSERNLRVVYADGGQDFYSRGGDGTIRKLFALSIGENSVHGSDSLENAGIEIAQFFTDDQIVG